MKTIFLALAVGFAMWNAPMERRMESNRIAASREEVVSLRAEIERLHADINNLRENDSKGREEMMRLSREFYYVQNPKAPRLAGD